MSNTLSFQIFKIYFTAESGRKSGGSGVVASETEQRSAAADEAALSARRSAGRPADTVRIQRPAPHGIVGSRTEKCDVFFDQVDVSTCGT